VRCVVTPFSVFGNQGIRVLNPSPTRFLPCTRDKARGASQSLFALILSASLLASASAAIAPGGAQSGANAGFSGNGELFLSVFDSAAKISYTKDLGITLNDFFVWGQQDAGNQRFWVVDDAQWTSLLAQTDPAALRWSVLGFDTTGGTAQGGVRLFTTARQGDEGAISSMTNQRLTNGTGSTQAGTFFVAVNSTPTHGAPGASSDFAANGSSVNADADPGNGYFGDNSVGLSTTLNGNAPFDNSNRVGESSWFYYLTRSGAVQLNTVLVDEFDNLGHDGYWGFLYVDPVLYPASPYRASHLLSYTLPAYDAATPMADLAPQMAALMSFRSARFEEAGPMNPVPEPGSWALLTGGLLGLLAWTRSRSPGSFAKRSG
jgi:hypothetical protein